MDDQLILFLLVGLLLIFDLFELLGRALLLDLTGHDAGEGKGGDLFACRGFEGGLDLLVEGWGVKVLGLLGDFSGLCGMACCLFVFYERSIFAEAARDPCVSV